MKINETINFIEKWYNFPCIYYPRFMQLEVFVNNTDFFIYEEEELSKYDVDDLVNKLEDDLFSYNMKGGGKE